MAQTASHVQFKSPLFQMTQTTPTCLWNDSAAIEELTYSIEHGAVGATCNPSIAVAVAQAGNADLEAAASWNWPRSPACHRRRNRVDDCGRDVCKCSQAAQADLRSGKGDATDASQSRRIRETIATPARC